jgi:chorismate dehydratase
MSPASRIAAMPRATMTVGRIPYLNCAPFFHGLGDDRSLAWREASPSQLGAGARDGELEAGPIALADFLRLQDSFERLGHLGVAVRGRCGSALLFARKPLRQLHDATIAVTAATSTTALLLRLILERRYELTSNVYQRDEPDDADAVLLIGDDALRFRASNRRYPYEIDLAFEWWLWQHLPCVFAVWAIRTGADPQAKDRLNRLLQRQLAVNLPRLDLLANERAEALGVPAEELTRYLASFVYRFGDAEERAIKQFEQLAHAHHLL